MMSSNDVYAVLIVAAIAGYFLLLKGSTNAAEEAGKWVAEKLINPILPAVIANPVSVQVTAQRGIIEGSGKYYLDTVHIPETPEGYSPSNWTWKFTGSNTILGLPAGMTPEDFCKTSPYSPVCTMIEGG